MGLLSLRKPGNHDKGQRFDYLITIYCLYIVEIVQTNLERWLNG